MLLKRLVLPYSYDLRSRKILFFKKNGDTVKQALANEAKAPKLLKSIVHNITLRVRECDS